jgi:general secretion pathway protein C
MMAFFVWGLLALTSVYWLMQLLSRPLPTPAQAVLAADQPGTRVDMTRLFGATPVVAAPEVVADSRFKLIGVVAANRSAAQNAGEGVALIAVDGVPRTVRVGAVLDGDLRLLAVNKGSASLGQGGVTSLTLQIVPAAPAATGSLPPAAPSPVVLGGAPMGALAAPASMPLAPPQGSPPQEQPSPVGQQTR